MSKSVEYQARFSGFIFRPEDLTIVGEDEPLDEHNAPFDDADRQGAVEVTEELIESIAEFGIREAVKIVKVGPKYYVTSGRRRVKAARIANKRGAEVLVPCITDHMAQAHGADVSTWLSNTHRVDSPTHVKAKHVARLLAKSWPLEKIAREFNTDVATIKTNWLPLLSIPEPQRAAVVASVGTNAAAELAKLPPAELQQAAVDVKAKAAETGESTQSIARGRARTGTTAPAGQGKFSGHELARLLAFLSPNEKEPLETEIEKVAFTMLSVLQGKLPVSAMDQFRDLKAAFRRVRPADGTGIGKKRGRPSTKADQ